jgi:hypothetical protein
MSKLLSILAAAIVSPALWAVDGVVLINQATVNAAGGFPYVISQPGSYKLSGNLITTDPNKNVIMIAADHVTLDLGGFSILGPTDCAGSIIRCTSDGTGSGIITDSVRFNITIRNGTIQGMGSIGIQLSGDSHLVELMHIRSNGFTGIAIVSSTDLGGSIAQNNTVQRNAGNGIVVNVGSVDHNTISTNGANGIIMNQGRVSDNYVSRSNIYGMSLGSLVLYKGNSVNNSLFGSAVGGILGGFNMGQNLCEGTLCP